MSERRLILGHLMTSKWGYHESWSSSNKVSSARKAYNIVPKYPMPSFNKRPSVALIFTSGYAIKKLQ